MNKLRSGCKVNLGLRVTGVLPNGRHSLSTVFYPLSEPYDSLEIRKKAGGEFLLHCRPPMEGVNILETTLRVFNAATGANMGAEILLDKGVPQGAGLGGASGDAAIFLKWLSDQLPAPLPPADLAELGGEIGADVPFFLYNRPCAASGAGEILTPIRGAPEFWLILIWPGIILSTARVFQTYDTLQGKRTLLTNSSQTYKKFFRHISALPLPGENDLEAAAIALCPQLAAVKRDLQSQNPDFAGMSGSGSSFYGIFFNYLEAKKAKARLEEKYFPIYLAHFAEIAGAET